MHIIYIISILFFVIGLILKLLNSNKNIDNENKDKYNYIVMKSIMTSTEIKFCKQLKLITDKYNLIIIPQVQLQKVFKAYSGDIKSFNKIKAKSIDFAIVDNEYNYKLFVELDDYTHNRKKRIERDTFVNDLFNRYNIAFKRVNVSQNYDNEYLENIIKEVV